MTETKKIIIDEIKKIYDQEIPGNNYELEQSYNMEDEKKNNVASTVLKPHKFSSFKFFVAYFLSYFPHFVLNYLQKLKGQIQPSNEQQQIFLF